MKKTILHIIILFAIVLMSGKLYACVADSNANTKSHKDSIKPVANNDTSFKSLNSLLDKTAKPKKQFVMTKSPTGAVIRSLIIPGWGQLYYESYWKAPLFFGGSAVLCYQIFHYNGKYNDYADKVDAMSKINPQNDSLATMKLNREFYRDNRDRAAFYLLGVYILAAVDSYVGAHLYDFDVSDDLSWNLAPNSYGSVSLNFSISTKKLFGLFK